MLRAYLSRARNASVLVPIGGITALSNVAALAGGRVLLLAGDKAYNHEEELAGARCVGWARVERAEGAHACWHATQDVRHCTLPPARPSLTLPPRPSAATRTSRRTAPSPS